MLLKSLAGSNFNSIDVSTDSSLSEATKRGAIASSQILFARVYSKKDTPFTKVGHANLLTKKIVRVYDRPVSLDKYLLCTPLSEVAQLRIHYFELYRGPLFKSRLAKPWF